MSPVIQDEVLQRVEADGKGPGTLHQNKKDLGQEMRTQDS